MNLKRIIAALLLTLTAFALLPVTGLAMTASATTWTTADETVCATGTVNVRTRCSSNGTVVGILTEGETVKRIAIGSNGWSKITFCGKTRYASSSYLAVYTEEYEVVYATGSVNVRTGPAKTYESIGKLQKDNAVQRIEELSNGWSKILYNGGVYYASSSYLTTTHPSFDATWTKVSESKQIVFAKSSVNLRMGPSTSYTSIHKLAKGDAIKRIETGSNGWSKVEYKGNILYMSSAYATSSYPYSSPQYPMHYYDKTVTISISKEYFDNGKDKKTGMFIAHVQYTNYTRFMTRNASGDTQNDFENSKGETMPSANKRLNPILCVNGDNARAASYNMTAIVRNRKAYTNVIDPPTYCQTGYTGAGEFIHTNNSEYNGLTSDELVNKGIRDTFSFGGPYIIDGQKAFTSASGYSTNTTRAQRTFIGMRNPGDVYIVVTNGRRSAEPGLTYANCYEWLKNRGVWYGFPIDGGGSSCMYFLNMKLNDDYDGRLLHDFIIIK